MPLYYFDVHDRDGFHQDKFGDEFDSLGHAVIQVQMLLPAIARDNPPNCDHRLIACELRDEAGQVVYRGELIYLEMHVSNRE